jgi:two-component system nitrate/nitrite response regulator NarL
MGPDRSAGRTTDLGLLVVDDHRVFAEALARRLLAEPFVASVRVARSVGEARALVNRTAPDVVLLDHVLGDARGADLLPDLGARPRPPTVLLVSATDEPTEVVSYLRAGVDGWVSKDIDYDGLLASIRAAVAGHVALVGRPLDGVVKLLLREDSRAQEGALPYELTPREREVLECLVGAMSTREIAEHLFISGHTVRTHIQHLLRRAGMHSTAELVADARARGIRARATAPSSH